MCRCDLVSMQFTDALINYINEHNDQICTLRWTRVECTDVDIPTSWPSSLFDIADHTCTVQWRNSCRVIVLRKLNNIFSSSFQKTFCGCHNRWWSPPLGTYVASHRRHQQAQTAKLSHLAPHLSCLGAVGPYVTHHAHGWVAGPCVMTCLPHPLIILQYVHK
jgi:hypothetical protein